MTAATIAVAAVLLVLLAIWVAAPLLGPRRRLDPGQDVEVDALIDSKLQIYRAILDLESDHAAGKVSDEDHAVMRRQLESDAIAIMRRVEMLDPRRTIDSLEREIAAVRERLRSDR